MVYILEQITGSQERHICSIHASTPILSSIPSSTKPWKINVFRHSHNTKNHQKHLQNPSNPYKIRLQSNLIKNHKIFSKNLHKISKKSLYKFPFFLSKIKHFPQSDHLKIALSPNPSKFTSPIQTSHTHLRPKFGICSRFYLPAKIHNIKKYKYN